MSDDENKNESERIAELERQVADLREQLGDKEAAQEEAFFKGGEAGGGAEPEPVPGPLPTPSAPADPRDQRELVGHMPSRQRAIIIGVCVGAFALAAIIAIVVSLSQVITPLSKSAAGALEPFERSAKRKAPAPKREHPPVKTTSPLRAPGL